MTNHVHHLIQIIEKIGLPLIDGAGTAQGPDATPEKIAETVAELLSSTVKLSIETGNMAQLAGKDDQDDSVRIALAALSGPVIGRQYVKSGVVPDEKSLEKITACLKAVLSFSENFKLSEEAAKRLDALDSGAAHDQTQIDLHYMQAMLPVAQAIAHFPFGQPEQKLVTAVTGRLRDTATTLRQSLFSDSGDELTEAQRDLVTLKTLATLYAHCHEAETKRLEQTQEGTGDSPSLDSVWAAFDLRVSMLESLVGAITGRSAEAVTGADVAPATAADAAPAPEPPAKTEAPPPSPPPEPEQSGTGSPMGFFSKKPKAEEPAAPPPQDSPPAPEPEPKTEPPASAPADKEDTGEKDESQSTGGGGPMSFFSKKDSDES